jgi:hypothetical protein
LLALPDARAFDELVAQTARTFYEREAEILAASDAELLQRYGTVGVG